MKTIDIEIAMMKALNHRQNLIVPNVSWGIFANRECDLIMLSSRDYATEIEIKVSKQDLKKDSKKRHNHISPLLARVYFAVPDKLEKLALEIIPDHAGLYIIKKVGYYGTNRSRNYRTTVHLSRECKRNKMAEKWTMEQRYQLARLGSMRILGLKIKLQTMKKQNQLF